MLLALALRLWGINFGLPYTYAADEPTHFSIALRIFKTGDLNPHWLNYPSLMFYTIALALVPFYSVGKMLGIFVSPSDLTFPQVIAMGVGRLDLPAEFLYSRMLTAVIGTLSLVLVYLIGRKLGNSKWIGLIATMLFAVSPASVFNSHLIRPDTYAVFFALLAVIFALRILDGPGLANYILSGVAAGLAVSSKYNMPLIVLPMLVAHFFRYGTAALRRREIYIGSIASILAFLLTTPFALLDVPLFLQGFGYEVVAQAEGHVGAEGGTFLWYLSFLWSTEGVLIIAAVVQAARLAWTRSRSGLVLLSFPLVYFVFVDQFIVRNDRTLLPMLPFLHLLAALFVNDLHHWLTESLHTPRTAALLGNIVVCAFMVISPLQTALASDLQLTEVDSRETARVWLNENLPAGSRIAQEAYTPYLDTRRFAVQGAYGIIDHTPDWYVHNGFEYLILGQGMYGRFFAEPDRYQTWVDKYNEIFSRFSEIKRFNDNGYEVRIYKTGIVLPPHRVAARFGNEGELIELVGYDDVAQKWVPGQPLKVKLTWRTIEQKSEPFEVELRLLDKDGREVGSARGDLFQGQGWPEGMFSTEWTIPVQASAVPSAYQLEVNVIESRYAYRTPARNWAGDNLDQVALGPIKMGVIPPTTNELQTLHTADVRFGDAIGLVGYTPPGDARLGSSLPLTLYWQSLAKLSTDYTVFVHLVDADARVVAQVDAQPHDGAYPTSLWEASEIIADGYDLQVPVDLAPGSYRVEIGLYEYPSLTRLPAVDAKGNSLGDHWVLPDAIQVVQ